MKKFTFLLVFFMIALMANTQNKNDLQIKIQQVHEKFSAISQQTALLSKQLEIQTLNPKLFFKSTAVTQKLDSTVNRVLNTEPGDWQYDYKDEFIYDSEMKNTTWLEKEWNITTNSWDTLSKVELGYDNSDRINSMLIYDLDALTKELIQESNFLVFYNSDGMQDSTLTFSTKNAGVSWDLEMKQINHYNASKQLIKTDMWMMDEDLGILTPIMNMVYAYKASGKIESESTSYVMEGEEFLWSKIEYNYDGAEKLTSTVNSSINFETGLLDNSFQNKYQYNASGDVSIEIYSTWNDTSWIDEDKTVTEYNTNGDVSVEIYSTWNGTSWIEDYLDEFTYNDMTFSDVIFPYFTLLFDMENQNDITFNKAIAGINSFEMLNGSWKNTDITTFYYSGENSTNISEIENSEISVYPNPASESIKFNWKGNKEALVLQIYQITGAKVIDQIAYSGKAVSISQLENGVYFFKLLNGQQMVYAGKMIKR